jgi:predicted transposase YbfD/YdcC
VNRDAVPRADLRDVLITADALHCQRKHAAWLHARGGHYLFSVKSNQPALRRALPALTGRGHRYGR